KTYILTNNQPQASKYSWRLSSGGKMDTSGFTASVNWTTIGNHSIIVKYTGVCAGNDSVQLLKVNVTDAPLNGTFTNMLPEDKNFNLSLPVTFSWLPIEEAINYDLYIWKEAASKPVSPTVANINGINYIINNNTIEYEQVYSWQLAAKKACFTLASPVQTFKLRYLPDLVVNNIQAPASGFSGQSISVQWETKNIGKGGTLNQGWVDAVYLSKDAILEPATDYLLGTVPNPSELGVANSYVQMASFILPKGIDGAFYVFVVTNQYDQLIELNKTNNTLISSTTTTIKLTPPPDLKVTSIIPPNVAFSGQNVNVTWRVDNAGTGSTQASYWIDRLYLSKDSSLNFGSDYNLGSFARESALNVGENYSKTQEVKIPEGIFGTYYLFVITDFDDRVYEHAGDRNNTSRSDSISIRLTPPIDLVVTQMVSPGTASNNEKIAVQWRVENQGGSSTDGRTWSDRVYLSKATTFKIDSALLVSEIRRYSSLNPEDGYNEQQEIKIPSDINGVYYLYVVADAGKEVYEYTYEDNNIRRSDQSISIQSPDLIVSDINAPSADSSGKLMQLKWVVKNDAAGTLFSASITDKVFLSTDATFNLNNSIELKQLLHSTGELLPADTINREALVRLPEGITGDYYIYVHTDFTNSVYEAGKEDNNRKRSVSAIKISLSPWADLQASDIQ
ncbi:MAG: hypothetical protein H0U44_12325, partial [Flavisolibacter sp.]|nr:hypothetical protein [Flavisolibacter sp.]